MIKLPSAMTGGGFDDGGEMVPLVAPHRANHSDVVDDAADVWEPIRNRSAGLAVLGKRAEARNDRAFHGRQVVTEPNRIDELTSPLVVLRIKGVDMADAAAHEEKDDRFRLRGVMRTNGGVLDFSAFRPNATQGEPEKAAAELMDKAAARDAAA